jgi:hypothetical protein
MPEPKPQLNRRHTDGAGNDVLRAARLAIAEHAYHLYVEGGCDRTRVAEYWRLAEQTETLAAAGVQGGPPAAPSPNLNAKKGSADAA